MTIADQLNAANATLTRWVKGEGGTSAIAGDKSQLVNLLSAKPGAPRLVTVFMGETPRGDNPEEMAMVDRTFWTIISRGQGLKLQPGDSLTEGSAGGKAMYKLVEAARDQIRTMMFDPQTTERPIYYRGIQPFADPDCPRNDACVIEWAVGTLIGDLTDDPEK